MIFFIPVRLGLV